MPLSIPFTFFNKLIAIEMQVNGVSGHFIFDSGAPMVVINKRYLAHFGLDEDAATEREAQGAGGAIDGMLNLQVDRIVCGDLKWEQQAVLGLNIAHLEEALNSTVHGLLGVAQIRHLDWCIDYAAQRLHFFAAEELNSTPPTNSIGIHMAHHLPIIELSHGERRFRIALDSGAEKNMLSPELEDYFTPFMHDKEEDTLIGADNQRQSLVTAQIDGFQLNGQDLAPMPCFFASMAHLQLDPDGPIHGLFGYPLLSSGKFRVSYVNERVSWELGAGN